MRCSAIFNGDIQVGFAVKVVVVGEQRCYGGLLPGDIAAGRVVFFDVDVAVGHEAEVQPGPYLEGEEGEEQKYGPAAGVSEVLCHGAGQGKV